MKVADLMMTDLQTVNAEVTIADAIITLADAHVLGLAVYEPGTYDFIGVLSTSDVLVAAAECTGREERNSLFDRTTVRDLMTRAPATTTPDADVKEAAQQMLYLDVHRLFVADGGKLVGVISQSDIVRAVGTAKI